VAGGSSSSSRSVERVRSALQSLGLAGVEIVSLDASTRTAVEAAAVVGCELGAIVKSLVFASSSSAAVLALVSGDRRADEALVAAAAGEPSVGRADADFVRATTGFAIGGVAPVGHPSPLLTVMDEDLLRFDVVWAAAGSPYAVFGVAPAELARAIGVTPARIAAA
jgi:prolyl-tRNA editing enzyme YbaK/EbsC (Cys-tRNA(Pro) deacylase)